MAVHRVFAVGARVMRLRSQLIGQRLGIAPDTYNPSTWAKQVDAGIEQAVSLSEKESFCELMIIIKIRLFQAYMALYCPKDSIILR